MTAPKHSAQTYDTIAARIEDGEKPASIAKSAGLSKSAVYYTGLRLGADRPDRKQQLTGAAAQSFVRGGRLVRKFTDIEDQELRAMRASGESYSAIGRALGRAPHTVLYRLMILARNDARKEVHDDR